MKYLYFIGLAFIYPLVTNANYSVTDSEIHGLDVDNGRVVIDDGKSTTKEGYPKYYYICNYNGQPYYCSEKDGGKAVPINKNSVPTSGPWDPNHDFSHDRY